MIAREELRAGEKYVLGNTVVEILEVLRDENYVVFESDPSDTGLAEYLPSDYFCEHAKKGEV